MESHDKHHILRPGALRECIRGLLRNRYLRIFILGAAMYMVCAVPFMIWHRGIFFYYGDYNVQQVPFYIMAHRAVRRGFLFWNPQVDLGGSMGGSFAFYLWGSPFFWMTIPFPEEAVPFLLPFLMALRCGTAQTLAYAWLRTQTRTHRAALLGAMLYAFSGFQACNIVFQHFHDVTAFFPLYLLSFDRFCEGLRERKILRGFSLMTAFMAVLNYYFFTGEAVFLALYYFVRHARFYERRRELGVRGALRCIGGELGRIVLSFLLGLWLAAGYLVQAADGLLGNTRISELLGGRDLLVYPEPTTPAAILKSFFLVPDLIAKSTLFGNDTVRNASLSAYLPGFSVTGAAAFCMTRGRGRDWRRRLLCLLLLMALIPAGNALFSALNQEYYARWFYLPVLLMAGMTAKALEENDTGALRKGLAVSAGGLLLIAFCAWLPVPEESRWSSFFAVKNEELFLVQLLVSVLSLFIPAWLVFSGRKTGRGSQESPPRQITRMELNLVMAGCVLCTAAVLGNGNRLIARSGGVKWRQQLLETRPELPETAGYVRVETGGADTNYEMVWGYPTIHCFASTVHPSIFRIFEGIGMVRTVESSYPFDRIGIRALLSLGYYIENGIVGSEDGYTASGGLPGFVRIASGRDEGTGGHNIYRNRYVIPMGFTFERCISEESYDAMKKDERADRLLVRDLILTREQIERFGGLLSEESAADIPADISLEDFFSECMKRAESACRSVTFSPSGFAAETAMLPQPNLVVFSVPYDRGFTAFVDGKRTEIERVAYGMIAVPVPEGEHRIEFRYLPAGLYPACAVSFLSALFLILPCLRRRGRREDGERNRRE